MIDRDIKRILEDQQAFHGSFLPLPDRDTTPDTIESGPELGAEPEPEPEQSSGNDPAHADPWARLLSAIPVKSPLHGLNSLDEVADYVARTILVPIDKTRTNPVPGVGNPNADLMIIGEAPGADEDRLGVPFVGRAGKLLDKILGAIDFSRDDVYIANILKSRPPNNRDPEPDEIKAHLPILLRQIYLVKPRLLLCVGRVAGNVLLEQKTTLKALREKNFHDFHGVPMMVTYHPAALLRSSTYKRPTWEDVQALRVRFDEIVAASK